MINRDNSLWAPCSVADIDWTETGTPRSRQFGDIYYSADDGLAESHHVYLEGNRLAARLANPARAVFRVGELGFGSGLNFLLTWQLFRDTAPAHARLHYWSCERYPLRPGDLRRALDRWPGLAPLAAELLAVYPLPVKGQHRCLLDAGRVTLDLSWEDVGDGLEDLARGSGPCIDAWYLDGFAPAGNSAMWHTSLWRWLGLASRTGATFATFTAAGDVRRGLQAAGFTVHKRPGYGRKRDSLHGALSSPPAAAEDTVTPWDRPARRPAAAAVGAIVLGGGLAGCMTAAALARRGMPVTLMESGTLASRGSGNSQGVLYTRLSHRHSALTDFSVLSYLFALREYAALFDRGALIAGIDGALCGCFLMQAPQMRLQELRAVLCELPELAEVIDRETAALRCGLPAARGGVWLPGSGWLDPRAVCRAVCSAPAITVVEHCGPTALTREGSHWVATPRQGHAHSATIAVVAAGTASAAFPETGWLPLRAVRGQTTVLPSSSLPGTPAAAFCHTGYIAPAREGYHCLGATFDPGDTDTALRDVDHRRNLDALGAALPTWQTALSALETDALSGRAELRCASPDYLPIVGPVPDAASWRTTYAPLADNARRVIPVPGHYVPDLFVNTAHGSRGLTTTPLAAELIASLACGEPVPLNRSQLRALAPGRFIIRDIIRSGRQPE